MLHLHCVYKDLKAPKMRHSCRLKTDKKRRLKTLHIYEPQMNQIAKEQLCMQLCTHAHR